MGMKIVEILNLLNTGYKLYVSTLNNRYGIFYKFQLWKNKMTRLSQSFKVLNSVYIDTIICIHFGDSCAYIQRKSDPRL